jgi:hypothetical protein
MPNNLFGFSLWTLGQKEELAVLLALRSLSKAFN